MTVRVAINGFGRVGRAAYRAGFERGADIEWVAINDLAPIESLAQLLKYDSVYGRFPGKDAAGDGMLRVDDSETPVFAEADPAGHQAAPPHCARKRSRCSAGR